MLRPSSIMYNDGDFPALRHPHYKADTRQGVAVEYLTEPKTA